MDSSPPGSSIHGVFQARVLEWVAISSSRGSSRSKDQTRTSYISCLGRQILSSKCSLIILTAFFPPLSLCLDRFWWRRQWYPTPVLLPGKSHGWRSLVGCSPWGREESDTTERFHFHFSLSCTEEGNVNSLQYSCLENPRDGGAWWAAVYGVTQSRTRLKRLSIAFIFHSLIQSTNITDAFTLHLPWAQL